MGILRADRVSGLGGANAINGSTFFNGDSTTGTYLRIDTGATEDLTFGTGDFTFEFWVYSQAVGFQQHFYDGRGTTNSQRILIKVDTANTLFYYDGTANRIQSSSALATNEWVHVALVRESATTKMYVNGTQTGSTHTGDNVDFVAPAEGHGFIGSNGGTDGIKPSAGGYFHGFLSNFRIVKGTAVYTGNFTPPTTRLTAIDGTVLLTCTSPSNVEYEATGKTIISSSKSKYSNPPVASRFVPDKGEDHGTTLGDNTKFDTLSYMVPPGGTTVESNRGRALFGGGSTVINTIQYFNIQSQGNTQDFGDLLAGRYETECAASSTRGIWAGGYQESPNVKVDTIEYVTIATTSNATDFGNLTVARGHTSGASNSTRGIISGGTVNPSPHPVNNTIDYFTIATTGDATNFGDSTVARKSMGGGRSSTTRAIFCAGTTPTAINTIDYVTIATTGDAADFGDTTQVGWAKGAGNVSSGTRGVLGGGYVSPANINTIEYLTIASTGNGTDFGDLIEARRSTYAAGSTIRGVFGGGKNPANVNTMDYVTIASTGNALDFGDMINTKSFSSGLSDCHGGL